MKVQMQKADMVNQEVIFSSGQRGKTDASGNIDVPEADYLCYLRMGFTDKGTRSDD